MITTHKTQAVSANAFYRDGIDQEDWTATMVITGITLWDILRTGLAMPRISLGDTPSGAEPILLVSNGRLARIFKDVVPQGWRIEKDIYAIPQTGVETEPGTIAIRYTADAREWARRYRQEMGLAPLDFEEDPDDYPDDYYDLDDGPEE